MVSTTVSVFACAGMAFAKTPLTLGAIVFVAGFSLGIGQPLTMSLVSQKTAANERALAASAGASGVFIGLSVLLATSLFGAASR